jgi:hypothetical protein
VGIKVVAVAADGALPEQVVGRHRAEEGELVLEQAAMHLIQPLVQAVEDKLSTTEVAGEDGAQLADLADHIMELILVVLVVLGENLLILAAKQYLVA